MTADHHDREPWKRYFEPCNNVICHVFLISCCDKACKMKLQELKQMDATHKHFHKIENIFYVIYSFQYIIQ
jgi:hypothetical protein